ncbi:MAG: phenylalanine--tRNA ligase subunit alpha, partial [Candidatus Nanoarchaeia archaeon]
EEKFALDIFKKRKNIISKTKRKLRTITLTPLGEKLATVKLDSKLTEHLTHEMLKTGLWKKQAFRRYDVKINVPKIYRGKRHFVNQATDYAKNVWIEMGFREMTGQKVQTCFWNFDALFTAQDHPVREMQDTFFIGRPVEGKLPKKEVFTPVKAAHEDGGDTGSKGWQYAWTQDNAIKNVLRTHTTALSSKTLSRLKKKDLPAKYFAVGKCFRNETVDWSHLFEFNQFEGIVIDPDANFKNLLGYLKAFAAKIGFTKVRFRPAYFPYTEPSVEGDVYDHVHKKWIEVFAAGVFRPEVVKPLLGEDVPVLAWGPGLDRMMLKYYEITDLRDLYRNDINQLRTIKEWMR